MTRPQRRWATSLFLALAICAAGCGSSAAPPRPIALAPSAYQLPLTTSLSTATGTWAVVPMAANPVFWQLLVLPRPAAHWTLVTPPGIASNGGLVLTASSGSLMTGIRPSQHLTFSPIATTSDSGASWTQGLFDGTLAYSPDSLAANPGGSLIAVAANGDTELTASPTAAWTKLTTQAELAATPAGRQCGLGKITAVSFSPQGAPLLAGACSHPGIAGIFAFTGGTWHAAGPPLLASFRHQTVTVMSLSTHRTSEVALLVSGTGTTTTLAAAWSTGGNHWGLSPGLSLAGTGIRSSSFGYQGTVAVVLANGHGEASNGPGSPWRSLPTLPTGTVTLAMPPTGGFGALAVHGSHLSYWQLPASTATWHLVQTVNVPIQYGSSG